VAGNKAKMSDDDKPPPVNSGAAFLFCSACSILEWNKTEQVEHIDNELVIKVIFALLPTVTLCNYIISNF
jgi:hypothetical protein